MAAGGLRHAGEAIARRRHLSPAHAARGGRTRARLRSEPGRPHPRHSRDRRERRRPRADQDKGASLCHRHATFHAPAGAHSSRSSPPRCARRLHGAPGEASGARHGCRALDGLETLAHSLYRRLAGWTPRQPGRRRRRPFALRAGDLPPTCTLLPPATTSSRHWGCRLFARLTWRMQQTQLPVQCRQPGQNAISKYHRHAVASSWRGNAGRTRTSRSGTQRHRRQRSCRVSSTSSARSAQPDRDRSQRLRRRAGQSSSGMPPSASPTSKLAPSGAATIIPGQHHHHRRALPGIRGTGAGRHRADAEPPRRKIVLVIDDEPIRENLRMLLDEWGYQSIVAADSARTGAAAAHLEGSRSTLSSLSDLHLGEAVEDRLPTRHRQRAPPVPTADGRDDPDPPATPPATGCTPRRRQPGARCCSNRCRPPHDLFEGACTSLLGGWESAGSPANSSPFRGARPARGACIKMTFRPLCCRRRRRISKDPPMPDGAGEVGAIACEKHARPQSLRPDRRRCPLRRRPTVRPGLSRTGKRRRWRSRAAVRRRRSRRQASRPTGAPCSTMPRQSPPHPRPARRHLAGARRDAPGGLAGAPPGWACCTGCYGPWARCIGSRSPRATTRAVFRANTSRHAVAPLDDLPRRFVQRPACRSRIDGGHPTDRGPPRPASDRA